MTSSTVALSSNRPTLLVHLSNFSDHPTMTAHMRVVIHVPKDRNKLDHSLVDKGSRVTHLIPANTPYAHFLADNFLFQLSVPRPYYKLQSPAHIRTPDEGAEFDKNFTMDLSIPVVKKDPQLKVYPLGHSVVDGVIHDVIGVECINVIMDLKHPTRKESVCYTLGTAKGLESEDLLEHLRVELEKLGFATTYASKESA